MLLSSSAASAVIFVRVGLQARGGDRVFEWAVIPIHWDNLISPTVPSYYTHPPTAFMQAMVGMEEDGWRPKVKTG